MIKAIIRFSANNRFIVLLMTAVAVGYGLYVVMHIPVDAIPDLSDTQVIIYSRWDRSPNVMEDQGSHPRECASRHTTRRPPPPRSSGGR